MVLSITTAVDADVDPLMGANVNVAYNDTMQDSMGKMAEGYLTTLMRYDIVTDWATLTGNAKAAITEFVARFIAVQGVAYDMSVYTSRIEAENMINIHLYRMRECKKVLMDQKGVTFIKP